MLPYFINIAIFLAYSPLFIYLNKKNKLFSELYYIIIIIQLIFLLSFRYVTVGNDTGAYVQAYLNQVPNDSLFGLLRRIVWILSGGNYSAFLFVLSFVTILCFVQALRVNSNELSKNFWGILTFLMFFYIECFNIERQMMATSIAFLAVSLWINRHDRILPILLFGIAFGIHNVTVCLLIAIVVWKLRNSKKIYLLLILLAIPFVMFSSVIFGFFAKFNGHYEMYANNIYGAYQNAGGVIIFGLFFFVISVLCILITDICQESKANFYLGLVFLGSIISIVGYSSYIVTRIGEMFICFIIFIISDILNKFSEKIRPYKISYVLAHILFFLIGILYLYMRLKKGYAGVVPYVFFWNA